MESLNETTIKGIPVIQNKQDFVIGVFTIKEVLTFTKYTHRLITGFDENEYPIYNEQIQREVEDSRVKKIADFLTKDPDASFPTNIVLHIPRQVIKDQRKEEELIYIDLEKRVFEGVKNNEDIYITIIDGQHRIKGIEEAIDRLNREINDIQLTSRIRRTKAIEKKLSFAKERLNDLKNIQLVVSFFIDKTLEYQAMIFSTINRTQKRVSADLVSSLFGLDTGDTPQKTALQVVLSLNGHPASPFYKRIKLYGGDYSKQTSPPLSQATMVKSIVSLISESMREAENDRYRERKELLYRTSKSTTSLPFRKYYAQDKDWIISDTLFYYFKAVKKTFIRNDGSSYWDFKDQKKPDNILQTVVGYQCLMKILVDIIKEQNNAELTNLNNKYENYLSKATDLEFDNQQKFPFSTKGKNILYLSLSLKIFPKKYPNVIDERQQKLDKLLE